MRAVVVLILLLASSLAGCLTIGDIGGKCTASSLVVDGTRFLAASAHPEGGFRATPDAPADPRLTAWALIAAALSRRVGYEDLIDVRTQVPWLESRLPDMMQEGTGVDSLANNLSLARAALQTWGRPATLVSVEDPASMETRTLQAAWEARYNATTGRYGERLNEHLFAGFAARLFESDAARLSAMTAALDDPAWRFAGMDDPFEGDVWFAAYARALVGPASAGSGRAASLDEVIQGRQAESGGLRSIRDAQQADASSTAAALLAWGESGAGLDDARVSAAVAFLCETRRADGAVPFQTDRDVLVVKTTAEVVAALALILQPIPRP